MWAWWPLRIYSRWHSVCFALESRRGDVKQAGGVTEVVILPRYVSSSAWLLWMVPTWCYTTHESITGTMAGDTHRGLMSCWWGTCKDRFFGRKPLWLAMDWNGSFRIDPRKARWFPWYMFREERKACLLYFFCPLHKDGIAKFQIRMCVRIQSFKFECELNSDVLFLLCLMLLIVGILFLWVDTLLLWYSRGFIFLFRFCFLRPPWRLVCVLCTIFRHLVIIIFHSQIKLLKINHLFFYLGTLSYKVSALK